MKFKSLAIFLFFFGFYSISFAQTTESEGYLMIMVTQQLGVKTTINIVSPDEKSELIELEKLPALSTNLMEVVKRNQTQILKVLETYRLRNYQLVSVSNELQGVVTNYIMRKK